MSDLPHIKMILGLSEYHIRNLRWLLRMAMTDITTFEGHLNTGDWCGELLWEIEQFMINHQIDLHANTGPDFLLEGWHGTHFPITSDKSFFATTLKELEEFRNSGQGMGGEGI